MDSLDQERDDSESDDNVCHSDDKNDDLDFDQTKLAENEESSDNSSETDGGDVAPFLEALRSRKWKVGNELQQIGARSKRVEQQVAEGGVAEDIARLTF